MRNPYFYTDNVEIFHTRANLCYDYRIKIVTRNSTVDEISERYRLNHAIVVNLTTSIFNFRVTFASLIGEP